MAKINWIKARTEYVTHSDLSFDDIAKKYGVNVRSVAEHAAKEQWGIERQKATLTIQERTIELTSASISSYNARKFLQGQQVADKATEVLLDPKLKIGGKVANEMLLAGHKLQTEALGLDNPKIAIQNNNIQNNIMSLDEFTRKMKEAQSKTS